MKNLLRSLFSFLLTPLEAGQATYNYQPSHRKVLLAVGALFILLASVVFVVASGRSIGHMFPSVVFGALGVLTLVVGALGSDRAVAKLWGNCERD